MHKLTTILIAGITGDSTFPGGAVIASIVNYVMYIAMALAVTAVVAGLGSIGWCRTGHGSSTMHNVGGRLLAGGIAGLIGLLAINTIIPAGAGF